jgi:hypothetical protein
VQKNKRGTICDIVYYIGDCVETLS